MPDPSYCLAFVMAWAVTFWVQASDCWRSDSMVAAAALLVGRTENLFSSCISSLRASLSALSFSIAALQDAHDVRGNTSDTYIAVLQDTIAWYLLSGPPLLGEELLRFLRTRCALRWSSQRDDPRAKSVAAALALCFLQWERLPWMLTPHGTG